MTHGTQPVSGAPIAQARRETPSVAVQTPPITTSFPALGRPVNHREAEYAPQFRNAHFAIAACQIDLVFIFRGHVLRSSLSNIFYSMKHKRVPVFSYFHAARQRERTPTLSPPRPFAHGFNVVRAHLARARLDLLHDSPHHPRAECFSRFYELRVLRV